MTAQSRVFEWGELAAVELLVGNLALGIADVNGATGSQREQVAAGVRRIQLDDLALVIEGDPVEDHEAAAFQRVPSHERLGQIIEAGPIDDYAGLADRVDEGPARGITQHKRLSAFAGVKKGLADTAVDDELSVFHDLRQLILGVTVNENLRSVNPRGQIVPGGTVDVNAHASGVRAQAIGDEAMTLGREPP